MGKKVTEENGVWELCPICENEVFILKNEISLCPMCHNQIIPCSMCIDCVVENDICTKWNVKV
ncbi:MAG: hypothetical protein QM217_06280 [Bacillota bacterium]|jgi:hypothetical protein|nr:hypothetical protein [Bacillota bacterium]